MIKNYSSQILIYFKVIILCIITSSAVMAMNPATSPSCSLVSWWNRTQHVKPHAPQPPASQTKQEKVCIVCQDDLTQEETAAICDDSMFFINLAY